MNFDFGDGDDVVDKALDVLEVDRAYALGAQSVSNGAGNLLGRKLNNLPRAQTGLGVGGHFGFDADHFHRRLGQLDSGSHSADQTSAADWRENGFDFRHIFENLQSDRALAGDDLFVVVR